MQTNIDVLHKIAAVLIEKENIGEGARACTSCFGFRRLSIPPLIPKTEPCAPFPLTLPPFSPLPSFLPTLPHCYRW
jgi:hypothetical protein